MKLIGKKAYITNKESFYYGEWGTTIDFDGEYYYIAIADDNSAVPVFTRNEFIIHRK